MIVGGGLRPYLGRMPSPSLPRVVFTICMILLAVVVDGCSVVSFFDVAIACESDAACSPAAPICRDGRCTLDDGGDGEGEGEGEGERMPLLEAERRLLVRKLAAVNPNTANAIVPIRVESPVVGRLQFFPAAIEGAEFAADVEPGTSTWWVALPAGANSTSWGYEATGNPPAGSSAPAPWAGYAAVFHLNGDLVDEVSGSALAGSAVNGVTFINDEHCLINGCASLGGVPAVLAEQPMVTSTTVSVLASVETADVDASIRQYVGLAITDNRRNGTVRTRFGLQREGSTFSAVALPDDVIADRSIRAARLLEVADGTRVDLAAIVTPTTLVVIANADAGTAALTAPLASTRSGRLVVGGDEGLVTQVISGTIDEIRLRTTTFSEPLARYELAAMKITASSTELQAAP